MTLFKKTMAGIIMKVIPLRYIKTLDGYLIFLLIKPFFTFCNYVAYWRLIIFFIILMELLNDCNVSMYYRNQLIIQTAYKNVFFRSSVAVTFVCIFPI